MGERKKLTPEEMGLELREGPVVYGNRRNDLPARMVSWVRMTVTHIEEDFDGRQISTTEKVLAKFVDDEDGAERFFTLAQEAADHLLDQRRMWHRYENRPKESKR